MLSEERVKLMTQMAVAEKKEARKIQPARKYSKKDYISLCSIGGLVVGTILYALVYGVIVLGLYSTIIINITVTNFLICLVLGIVIYILYMFFYLMLVRRLATKRFDEGVVLLKKLRLHYLQLEQLYVKEEALTSPEGWN